MESDIIREVEHWVQYGKISVSDPFLTPEDSFHQLITTQIASCKNSTSESPPPTPLSTYLDRPTSQLYSSLSASLSALHARGLGSLIDHACAHLVHNLVAKHLAPPDDNNNEDEEAPISLDDFSRPLLQTLLDRTRDAAQRLDQLLTTTSSSSSPSSSSSSAYTPRVEFFVFDALGRDRISRLFDMASNYPDSLPALTDLAACLDRTVLRHHLISSFRTAIEQRLLIPGAATATILEQYVSIYRVCRHLDPSSLLLSEIDPPVKRYLAQRRDTIRCLVSLITHDTSSVEGGAMSSLAEELMRGQEDRGGGGGGGGMGGGDGVDDAPLPLHLAQRDVESDEVALQRMDRWAPRPLEALSSVIASSRGLGLGGGGGGGMGAGTSASSSEDLLAMMVSIYGTRESFVHEYRTLLSDRLLTKVDYDIDREIQNVELLKMRFGENSLHVCEVMLKDLSDSKRMDRGVHAGGNGGGGGGGGEVVKESGFFSPGSGVMPPQLLHSTIISSLFWPTMPLPPLPPYPPPTPTPTSPTPLPRCIAHAFAHYAEQYHANKAPRKLQWRLSHGLVDMQVRVNGSVVSCIVTTLQAALLCMVGEMLTMEAHVILGTPPPPPSSSSSSYNLPAVVWTRELIRVVRVTREAIAAKMNLPPLMVSSQLSYWVKLGVLTQHAPSSSSLSMATNQGSVSYGSSEQLSALSDDDLKREEGGGDEASGGAKEDPDIAVYEQFIMGMLTNFGSVSLPKMHNMLKMFMTTPTYTKTERELAVILQRMVSQEKVLCEGDVYKKRK